MAINEIQRKSIKGEGKNLLRFLQESGFSEDRVGAIIDDIIRNRSDVSLNRAEEDIGRLYSILDKPGETEKDLVEKQRALEGIKDTFGSGTGLIGDKALGGFLTRKGEELKQGIIGARFGEAKKEAMGIRDIAGAELEKVLGEQAKLQYETMFKPRIRSQLNAQGILFGGAQQELQVQASGMLESGVMGATTKFATATQDLISGLGSEEMRAKYGTRREDIVSSFQGAMSSISNELAAELAKVSQPSTLDYLFKGGAQAAATYGSFKMAFPGMFDPSSKSSSVPDNVPFYSGFPQGQKGPTEHRIFPGGSDYGGSLKV
jgi:hypothetical protein